MVVVPHFICHEWWKNLSTSNYRITWAFISCWKLQMWWRRKRKKKRLQKKKYFQIGFNARNNICVVNDTSSTQRTISIPCLSLVLCLCQVAWFESLFFSSSSFLRSFWAFQMCSYSIPSCYTEHMKQQTHFWRRREKTFEIFQLLLLPVMFSFEKWISCSSRKRRSEEEIGNQ